MTDAFLVLALPVGYLFGSIGLEPDGGDRGHGVGAGPSWSRCSGRNM